MNVFISQPIENKKKDDILKRREDIFSILQNSTDEQLKLVDSLYINNVKDAPLTSLATAILNMEHADIVAFDSDWCTSKRCWCEYIVANSDKKQILFIDSF